MSSNTAAWQTEAKAKPLVLKAAEYPKVDGSQLIIKNAAIAINPIDHKLQDIAMIPLKYPTILGTDVAGEVVETGPSVTQFKKGDRVLACSVGWVIGDAAQGAFQNYTVVAENMTAPIPDNITFEQASVIPLTYTTAAAGLYQKSHLGLPHPTLDPKPTGQTLLIWGGATGVGACAIQMARSSGYEVFATASPHNFDFVKNLGAAQVFDYKDANVVNDIIKAFDGKTCAGAYVAIQGGDALEKGIEIVGNVSGESKAVACVLASIKDEVRGNNVRVNGIFATTIGQNEVGKAVFNDYLGKALASGKFVPAPPAEVVGKGLESIQDAMGILSKGVSAKKIVVSL